MFGRIIVCNDKASAVNKVTYSVWAVISLLTLMWHDKVGYRVCLECEAALGVFSEIYL